MSGTSQNGKPVTGNSVLRWPGGVVTAQALRESLNGERELHVSPRTVITPLAVDHLKTNGVHVVRGEQSTKPQTNHEEKPKGGWGYVQERIDSIVGSVIQALKREGMNLCELPRGTCQSPTSDPACGLARHVAHCVQKGDCRGTIVFCHDPGLVCCVANKVKEIRAVAIASGSQAGKAVKGLGANFLALEIGKHTFFELRQIMRGVCGEAVDCPDSVAGFLKELEGPCECQHPEKYPGQRPGLTGECQCGGGHAHR
jgi:ribose 5-phosphate isomerase RpiB